MKRIVALLFFTFSLSLSFAQRQLSEYAEISLLSCARGFDAASSYGHSAIRVKDASTDLDVVFNYGTFDFETDYFIPKFIKGTLDYSLSVGPYEWFPVGYVNENRSIVEQVLDLSTAEKQAIFDRLIVNYETDEKYYRYDFFFDNCSSRIHEILKEVLGENLVYGEDVDENSPETFRDLIDPYTKYNPWLDFGIGIIMGYPTDDIATNRQKMFLPDFLMERFDMATYNGKALIKSKRFIYKQTLHTFDNPWYLSPLFIFSFVCGLVLILSVLNFLRGKHYYFVDYLLFAITGLVGVFFLFMWFGTRHTPTYENMNMFWAMPLNLIAVFFLKNKKLKPYLLFMFLLNVLGYFVLPQVFTIAILPIAMMMAVRYLKLYLRLNKGLKIENNLLRDTK